mgnify:CR=1 FL=1
MKPFVLLNADSPNDDYKKSDRGYVDGYVVGADQKPYAVVVLLDYKESSGYLPSGVIVLAPMYHLTVTGRF